MRLLLRSQERKELDMIHAKGYWHKKFIIWPRVITVDKGLKEYAFLTLVYRKAVFYLTPGTDYRNRLTPVYKYRHKDDAVFNVLEHGDDLEFESPEARRRYEHLKEVCGE